MANGKSIRNWLSAIGHLPFPRHRVVESVICRRFAANESPQLAALHLQHPAIRHLVTELREFSYLSCRRRKALKQKHTKRPSENNRKVEGSGRTIENPVKFEIRK